MRFNKSQLQKKLLYAQLLTTTIRSQTYPKNRRSHIQGLCAVVSRVVPRFSLLSRLQCDSLSPHPTSGHTVPLLAHSSRLYLVVESVFFEVQLERTPSQSGGCIRGLGVEVNQWESRPQTETPKNPAVNHVLCSFCSHCHTRHDLVCFFYVFFLNNTHTLILMYPHTRAECLLPFQNRFLPAALCTR